MSLEKNDRRLAAVKLADAVNTIEGVPVSQQAKQLSARWARGEITGAEMKDALSLAHFLLAHQVLADPAGCTPPRRNRNKPAVFSYHRLDLVETIGIEPTTS